MKKNKTKKENSSVIRFSENTDYRYVVPFDPHPIEFANVNYDTDMKFLRMAKPDDEAYRYRRPLINAHLDYYNEYLYYHYNESMRAWLDIKKGAEAQKAKAQFEIDIIENTDIKSLL